MESEAKADSDPDWQDIDIFVFSNGQQYSPPRKYHLRAEDIDLWKSTLCFLAKTQYGPFHSTVDLFTIEGRKIVDPLELSNGGSYVAVQPPDCFIEAGYEKYLIKASRSWERRRLRKNETAAESDNPKNVPNMEYLGETSEIQNKSMDGHLILKSRVSSVANYDASTIIKPHLIPPPQKRSDSQFAEKQIEKKRASIQSPLIIKKITPSPLSAPNTRSSFSKKNDNIKTAIKITKPEERRHSSGTSGYIGTNTPINIRPNKTMRPPSKSKDLSVRPEAILPKIQEAGNELNTQSHIKVINTKMKEKLSTVSADLKNVFENKELVMISNLFQNPQKEMPSISVNAYPIQSISHEPVREQATTALTEDPELKTENINVNLKNTVTENTNTRESIEAINIEHNVAKNNALKSISIEKLQIEQSPSRTAQNIENIRTVSNTEVKIGALKSDDNGKNSPSRRRSIRVEIPDDLNDPTNVVQNFEEKINNETTISTNKNIETIEVHSSPPVSSAITKVLESHYMTNKTEESRVVRPTVIDKPLNDQYKATLKTGEVVNLKLNIEIGNCDGNVTKQNENLNSLSVIVIQRDKGSQSNIDDQIIAQNKSLLSLITKQIHNHHVGDSHRVIIVHYDTCKYCNSNAANLTSDKESNKNYMILLPIKQYEDERCHCNVQVRPEIRVSSVINPVKPTFSCMSLQRITKPDDTPKTTASSNICTADTKSNENVVMVTRKKSVAINEESALNTREPSKLIHEIHIKTQLSAVSMESVGIGHDITTQTKFTQTDWCDVLLEAKLLNDGHYTFRLPPLEMLKQYKLM